MSGSLVLQLSFELTVAIHSGLREREGGRCAGSEVESLDERSGELTVNRVEPTLVDRPVADSSAVRGGIAFEPLRTVAEVELQLSNDSGIDFGTPNILGMQVRFGTLVGLRKPCERSLDRQLVLAERVAFEL